MRTHTAPRQPSPTLIQAANTTTIETNLNGNTYTADTLVVERLRFVFDTDTELMK